MTPVVGVDVIAADERVVHCFGGMLVSIESLSEMSMQSFDMGAHKPGIQGVRLHVSAVRSGLSVQKGLQLVLCVLTVLLDDPRHCVIIAKYRATPAEHLAQSSTVSMGAWLSR